MEKYKPNTIIKVVLADDHEIFRDGFNVMLKKQEDIELVGEAANGEELIEQVQKLKPDVVITDIKMPLLDGIEATRILTARWPDLGIIALSMSDEENLIMDMLEAGAKGYLIKNAHKNEIFDAIKCVYRNEVYYCNQTSGKLIKMLANSNHAPYKKEIKPTFTKKEIEIIQLICTESSNKEIANKLDLSVRTIEACRERIQEKTGAKNMVGIVVYAIRNGIYKIE